MRRGMVSATIGEYRHALRRYGWLRDVPDSRDHLYDPPAKTLKALPARVDMLSLCPPVYHQGKLDSCTANAIAAALEFQQMRQRERALRPSRLFIYYNERVLEGTVEKDAGAMLRNGIKSVARWGAPPESSHWPYRVHRFAERPPRRVYAEASKYQAVVYQRLRRDIAHMRTCLAQGWPFVLGMAVRESFEGKAVRLSGRLSMPKSGESDRGGHAVMAIGYDDRRKRFLLRNSWGPRWGKKGYFTMPYDYVLDETLAADFWTIQLVE